MNNCRYLRIFFLIIIPAILIAIAAILWLSPQASVQKEFNGERALNDVKFQVNLGPRIPGSTGHDRIVQWISDELKKYGWSVEIQEGMIKNTRVRNIIGRHNSSSSPVIFGAHYDTREYADQDPDPGKRNQPVTGANDGASGVAVLLELARFFSSDTKQDIWLVFFDAEDQGGISNKEWILGSQYFASKLVIQPQAVVIVDMIGDANLTVYQEKNSTASLTTSIWNSARQIGYDQQFPAQLKYSMIDDHTPFLQRGIPAVDLIDFDYPYWHTTQDTQDKVSAESLRAVGNTLVHWLKNR